MELKELQKKKIGEILDERQQWNLPILEKDASIWDVLSILTARDHVWIVEERGSKKLFGVITESDVLRLLAPYRLPKYVFGKRYGMSLEGGTAKTAGDITHRQLIKSSLDEEVGEALARMVNARLRRLPVVKNGEIVGEITIHYILQKLLGKR
ncbi:MAG TPA: CBS domain-containing protein [Thermoplasmatales archaeon]|nr:MAG: CBS domain-containing protein [Thermoplasmata archaeon]RLF31731.1 MAG: CBS domain-containing protein [Thermoplasmata archaeon]HDN51073.1 CBS domain-containing protein [Thermoplasmatales archaeon]